MNCFVARLIVPVLQTPHLPLSLLIYTDLLQYTTKLNLKVVKDINYGCF